MFIVFLLFTIGAWLIYSSLKGQSLTDVFKEGGSPLNPQGFEIGGGDFPNSSGSAGDVLQGQNPIGGFDKGQFKGPNAALLERLRKEAVSRFKLTITQICRPSDATYGSPTSKHKVCRAFDASGKPADMRAYAIYAKSQLSGLSAADDPEVFYDPLGWSAPGYEHTTHVHTGA